MAVHRDSPTDVISGICLAFWQHMQMHANIDLFLHESKDGLSDWIVGRDVMFFRQFQDTHNDFKTMRLNSNDFITKLDFQLPDQYSDEQGVPHEDLPLDKYADIENLVRNTSPNTRCDGKHEGPREQWVYLTHRGMRFFPWDEDFIYMVQYAQGRNPLNSTGLYFAQCTGTASFLCGVWNTRSPALVHFLVEDKPLDTEAALEEQGFTYQGEQEFLRPVIVRIIEFPLRGAYTGLPWTTFPSNREQMLSIMTGDRLYEQFEPYHPQQQAFTRFGECMNKNLWTNERNPLFYVNEVEQWMDENILAKLGLREFMSVVTAYVFVLTTNFVTWAVIVPWTIFRRLVEAFLGKPLRGDEIVGDGGIERGGEPEDMMDSLFGGSDMIQRLLERARKNAESMSSRNVMMYSVSGTATDSGNSVESAEPTS